MVKLMLSERAKSKINFPTAAEVKECIPAESLLQGKMSRREDTYYCHLTNGLFFLELGGLDDYEWSLENDSILQRYGIGWEMSPLSPVVLTPPMSPKVPPTFSPPDFDPMIRPSRALSTASSYSSDDFYDALGSLSPFEEDNELEIVTQTHRNHATWATPQKEYSGTTAFGSPGPLTPIGIRSLPRRPPSPVTTAQSFQFLASLFGSAAKEDDSDNSTSKSKDGICEVDLTYRLTNLGLEQYTGDMETTMVVGKSIIQQYPAAGGIQTRRGLPHFPHLLPHNDPQSTYATTPLWIQLRRAGRRVKRFTRHLFRLSFTYHGALYWVLLYVFLRGPVEHSMKRLLAERMGNPRTVTFTTVGVAASLAGGLGASLSSSFGH